LGDLGVDVRIIINWSLEKQGFRVWPGFIWLKTESSGRLL
jgi:hypothetical protein